MEVEVEGPSLPSNYVTILQLKQRWLQQQQQQNPSKSNPNNDERNPQSNSKPYDEAAIKRTTPQNQHRFINQVKPENTPRADSAPKTLIAVASNHLEGEKEEHTTGHSRNKHSKKKSFRARKPRLLTEQNPTGGTTPPLVPEAVPEPVKEKEQPRYTGGRRSWNHKVVREPRFVTEQNPTGDTTPFVPEQVKEKEHPRRSWNQKVVQEPKQKTEKTPFLDHLSHNDDVAGAVKEINLRQGTNRRWSSGIPKPPFGLKKEQIWVKKGDSTNQPLNIRQVCNAREAAEGVVLCSIRSCTSSFV